MAQACDGIADCPGGEDERACEGAKNLTCLTREEDKSSAINLTTSPVALCRGALFKNVANKVSRSCGECPGLEEPTVVEVEKCISNREVKTRVGLHTFA